MSRIHWLGAGLSTHPGIKLLANTDLPISVWNRSLDKAQLALAGTTGLSNGSADAQSLIWSDLESAVAKGDILVSMLPGDFHVKVAKLCLSKGAHFVSSSYISPEMQALHEEAKEAGLSLVNEVGLDPGIDHLFAHSLVASYRDSKVCNPSNKLYFRSYCGGVPAVPNSFKYKFSWSPFGVLKALTSPAQWIENGDVQTIDTPWKAVKKYRVPVVKGRGDVFEAYPNRDSLPFINAYHFNDNWQVEQFVRGTLRLSGWSKAWAELFSEIESLSASDTISRLTEISDQLWKDHAYKENELDRVVLVVELEVRNSQGDIVWHQSRTIDDTGNDEGSSMARLVSHTVSLAVRDVRAGNLAVGVSAAPADQATVDAWLEQLSSLNGGFDHAVLV